MVLMRRFAGDHGARGGHIRIFFQHGLRAGVQCRLSAHTIRQGYRGVIRNRPRQFHINFWLESALFQFFELFPLACRQVSLGVNRAIGTKLGVALPAVVQSLKSRILMIICAIGGSN